MPAQIILITALILIISYAYTQRQRSRLVCYSVAASGLLGIFFVAFPGVSNTLANAVGIGRGADLVFYIFILVVLIAILSLHLHIHSLLEIITENTRGIALIEARLKEGQATPQDSAYSSDPKDS